MECQDKARRSSVPSIISQVEQSRLSSTGTAPPCTLISNTHSIAPSLLNAQSFLQPPPHQPHNADDEEEEEDLDDEDCEIDDDEEDVDDEDEDDEEASQHSLCEYFHHNTQLAATTGTVPGSSPGHHNFATLHNGHPSHGLAHPAIGNYGKHSDAFVSAATHHHHEHEHHHHPSSSAALGGLGVNRKRAFSFAASTSTTASTVAAAQTLCESTPSSTSAGSGSGYIQHASSSGGHASSIGSMGSEKRAATKICRVCGDKAYSYNFNVITCESCKAFFRRNANKEKEIRCPFSEQCDINVVSRRFCQRCRLQKCFRVGMKKEWIMSDEQRMEKKLRIQANRQRRMAERHAREIVEMSGADVADGDVSGPPHLLQMQPPVEVMLPTALGVANASSAVQALQEEQKQLLITEVLNAEAALHMAPVVAATTQPSPLDNLSAALAMNASVPIQQQMVVAAAAAQALNAHFAEKQQEQQQQMAVEGSSNLGPSAMTTTTTFCSPSTTSGILQQPQQTPSASGQPPGAASSSMHCDLNDTASIASGASIIDVVSTIPASSSSFPATQPPPISQLGTCEEAAAAALGHSLANAAVMQQQLNAAQHVVQQLVVEELVAKQQVAAAVAQQHYQQQQLAAAVAVAAASSILQQQQQQADAAVVSAALAHAQVTAEQPPPPLSSSAMDTMAMQPTLQPQPAAVTDASAQSQQSSVVQQSMQTPPEQELIAVPKDVLIKLVEHKIENEQRIESEQQHQMEELVKQQAPPPLKCQCRCQCGRYSSEELIVDRVMTDLLNPGGAGSNAGRREATIACTPSGTNQMAPDEAMDTAPPPPVGNHVGGEKGSSFTG